MVYNIGNEKVLGELGNVLKEDNEDSMDKVSNEE